MSFYGANRGWRKIPLREVGDFINGYAFKPSDWGKVGLPIIRIQNLNDSTKPYNFFRGRIDDRYLIRPGEILISWSASLGVFRWKNGDGWLNQHIFKAVPKSDQVDTDYFYWAAMREIESIAGLAHGSTMKHVTRKVFLDAEVPLPPLDEQRAIARALEAVQKAKETRQRELALERERKAALMEYLFTHGTRGEPTKRSEAGEIPSCWVVGKLGEVAQIERGKFAHRPRNAPEFYGGSIPFIQTGDVTASNGRIRNFSQTLNEKGLSISKMFPKGTVVITIAANIGFTGVLEFDSAFPDSLIGIAPTAILDTDYLNYYLTTQQPEMDRKAPRGTQKNINIEFLNPWPVVVPPLDEQREIATILRFCDGKKDVLQREMGLLNELFRTMLEELMTGRLSAVPLIEEHQAR
jgi:type I restriction enzyme S subunit